MQYLFHYTYRITNTKQKRHYYGTRTSKLEPKLDLGVSYFSSSKDVEFKIDQKLNSQDYRYKVLKISKTREEAINLEIRLHNKFDVGINPNFYNRAKQTAEGFDRTGTNHSIKTRCKMSASSKGKPKSDNP